MQLSTNYVLGYSKLKRLNWLRLKICLESDSNCLLINFFGSIHRPNHRHKIDSRGSEIHWKVLIQSKEIEKLFDLLINFFDLVIKNRWKVLNLIRKQTEISIDNTILSFDFKLDGLESELLTIRFGSPNRLSLLYRDFPVYPLDSQFFIFDKCNLAITSVQRTTVLAPIFL